MLFVRLLRLEGLLAHERHWLLLVARGLLLVHWLLEQGLRLVIGVHLRHNLRRVGMDIVPLESGESLAARVATLHFRFLRGSTIVLETTSLLKGLLLRWHDSHLIGSWAPSLVILLRVGVLMGLSKVELIVVLLVILAAIVHNEL